MSNIIQGGIVVGKKRTIAYTDDTLLVPISGEAMREMIKKLQKY